jgi:cytoskeletal protein CcmA (bactofilin family)
MSAAAPSPPAASPPPPPTAPPRVGAIRDSGTVRRDSVRASGWTTTGMAKVQGDVDVGVGAASGLVSVAGKLSADTFRARGTLEVVGPVAVRDQLTLDGTVHFQGSLRAGALELRGSLRCAGDLRVDRTLSARGLVEAPSAHAALFELTGTAEISGDLEAMGVARARFRGDSEIGTVRAKRVELYGPPTSLVPTLLRRVFGGSATVRIGRVEADSVELSAVDVAFVHAREIVLGPGAHVTAVEGTIVRQSSSSRVGPESRSPPPHGLSR